MVAKGRVVSCEGNGLVIRTAKCVMRARCVRSSTVVEFVKTKRRELIPMPSEKRKNKAVLDGACKHVIVYWRYLDGLHSDCDKPVDIRRKTLLVSSLASGGLDV